MVGSRAWIVGAFRYCLAAERLKRTIMTALVVGTASSFGRCGRSRRAGVRAFLRFTRRRRARRASAAELHQAAAELTPVLRDADGRLHVLL